MAFLFSYGSPGRMIFFRLISFAEPTCINGSCEGCWSCCGFWLSCSDPMNGPRFVVESLQMYT